MGTISLFGLLFSGILGGSSWVHCAVSHIMYEDRDEGLDATDSEFPFGIFGKSMHLEIKPTFRVDSVLGDDPIIDTIQPILFL